MNHKLNVTVLAETWDSPRDSLSGFNREVVKSFGKSPNVDRVTVFVPPGQDSGVYEDAKKCGAQLLEAEYRAALDGSQLLFFLPPDLDVDVVVGYGARLGPQAQNIKKSKKCKWVQFVYESIEELGMHKNCIVEYEKKQKEEIKLCEEADIVITIGPKLLDTFSTGLQYCGKAVDELTPGIFEDLSNLPQAKNDPQTFKILAFDRGTPADFKVEGYDIAAKAVAGMRQGKYNLIYVGAPGSNQEEMKNKFLEQGIIESQLRVRSLPTSREELLRMFSGVDLCIMPSRSEGFGFTALEALSAGVPILVNENSGFGTALKSVAHGGNSIIKSDNPEHWKQRMYDILEKARSVRLQEVRDLRQAYDHTYSWLEQCKKIIVKICNLPIPRERGCEIAPDMDRQLSGQYTTSSGKRRSSCETEEQEPRRQRKLETPSHGHPVSTGSSGKDSTDSASSLSHQELDNLARSISYCWYSFGIQLGEPDEILASIESNNIQLPAPEKKAYRMLTNWKKSGGTRAQLVAALRKDRKSRLAEEFVK